MMNFQNVKADNDLVAVICSYLGEPNRQEFWPCPFHQENTPSFHIYQSRDGQQRFKCHGCGEHGDVLDFVAHMERIDTKEAAKKLSSPDWTPPPIPKNYSTIINKEKTQPNINLAERARFYYQNRHAHEAQAYWASQGLTPEAIEFFKLGWTKKCPTYCRSPSVTIPYIQGGKVISLRHRLMSPNGSGRYRPEVAGLGNKLFNLDAASRSSDFEFLETDEILLVEGEVKAMVLDRVNGFRAIAIPGASSWQCEWADLIPRNIKKIYIALDPGVSRDIIMGIASDLYACGFQVNIVTLIDKPDDLFVKYGASASDFLSMLKQSKKYRNGIQ